MNYKIIILTIVLCVILLLLISNKSKNIEKFANARVDEIHYMFWTGGYDSTFRLCELLIDQKKTVQPLYVSLVLDNDCLSEESCNKLWLRRNRKEEGKSMNKIRKALSIRKFHC